MTNYVKQEKNDGKTRILNQRGNENITKLIENKVEYDGEEEGVKIKAQLQKCKNLKPNSDSTNDSIYSCTSSNRNIDNGKATNKETKSVITNDEGNNGEVAEAEAEAEAELEAEADTNNEKSNSSNTGIGRSNSKSNYVDFFLKRPDKNGNKMIENNVGHDGENPCETRETQQQKCERLMTIANQTTNDDGNGEKQQQQQEQDLDRIKTQSKSELLEFIARIFKNFTDSSRIYPELPTECFSAVVAAVNMELS